MPRKQAPAAVRLLKGRSPGRDSGGRVVEPPPRPVYLPPAQPPGLGTPVRREWRRVIAELVDLELPMPPAAVLVGYCRTLVRQREVAAALENEPLGTPAWRRLMVTERELSRQIATFAAEYLTQPAAPVNAGYAAAEHNPFDPDSGPAPWPPPGMSPEYAAMAARWGEPGFWRGHKLKNGARDDARAVKAWAEFDPIYAPPNGGPDGSV